MGTDSRSGVEKRLGGRIPEDEPTGIGERSTTQGMVQTLKRRALLAGGAGCKLKAVIDICGHCTFRGHTCSLQPRTSPSGGCKGGK